MSRKWNIALLQLDIASGDPDANFAKVESALNEAVRSDQDKPDIIVLPEMWNASYALERIGELADVEGRRTREMISAFCREHAVNVVAGSVAVKRGNRVTNTSFAFDRGGAMVAEYSKIHLFRLMEEDKHLTAGQHAGRMTLDGIPAGLAICYDLRFPELARKLAVDGAIMLFLPAQWPNPRLNHWRTLIAARAIENQMFVIACNRVGSEGKSSFFGHSMIVDPWGGIVLEGGEEEGVLRVSIDLEAVDRARRKIRVFEDRRPDLY